ncbi:histidine kinase [Catenulispora acidiphila DSM 44928]|uniref:Histidine kinase n=1 Tax=Catenulispora acidiphila (strain DSM 44928 / JCM 14897 / NBRC 102108 / NRRL B-24433 / ID139908) TaxID=479433 RepID=C7Q3P6_CATAD|nr:sensor histidine kinase [Catenulispora acidiphila]ACU75811.1 histidine kinase [Catenulispora acidiphila DSM 44928]
MITASQPTDRSQLRRLHLWYSALWLVFGLVPPAIAMVVDLPAETKSWSLALLAVLGLCYAAVRFVPGNLVLRPQAFLALLAIGLGVQAYVLKGGAAMFIISLPQFWILAAGPRRAIALSGAAALACLAGGAAAGAFLTGNTVFTCIGYAAGVLIGLLMNWYIRQSDERARRLSAELEETQRQLAEANRREGAAQERQRLAREIHDTLAQGFASIIVLAEAARAGIAASPAKSSQQLLSIERTARENLAEARVLVGSAPHVVQGSVAQSLRRTLDRFVEDTGLAVSAELPDIECDQQTRIALLRCTQESLANARKHAAASTIGVVLTPHPHGIELEITDDGRGFVVGRSRGFGLDGMRKRLADLGGELTVTSSPGDGTRVLAMIPTNDQG